MRDLIGISFARSAKKRGPDRAGRTRVPVHVQFGDDPKGEIQASHSIATSPTRVAIGGRIPESQTLTYHYEGQTSMPLIPMPSFNFFRPGMRPGQGGPQSIIRLPRLRR